MFCLIIVLTSFLFFYFLGERGLHLNNSKVNIADSYVICIIFYSCKVQLIYEIIRNEQILTFFEAKLLKKI